MNLDVIYLLVLLRDGCRGVLELEFDEDEEILDVSIYDAANGCANNFKYLTGSFDIIADDVELAFERYELELLESDSKIERYELVFPFDYSGSKFDILVEDFISGGYELA